MVDTAYVTWAQSRPSQAFSPSELAGGKSTRIAQYAKCLIFDAVTIAHSVGVPEPRQMRRRHVRLVQPNGAPIPMDEVYPGQV